MNAKLFSQLHKVQEVADVVNNIIIKMKQKKKWKKNI